MTRSGGQLAFEVHQYDQMMKQMIKEKLLVSA